MQTHKYDSILKIVHHANGRTFQLYDHAELYFSTIEEELKGVESCLKENGRIGKADMLTVIGH